MLFVLLPPCSTFSKSNDLRSSTLKYPSTVVKNRITFTILKFTTMREIRVKIKETRLHRDTYPSPIIIDFQKGVNYTTQTF